MHFFISSSVKMMPVKLEKKTVFLVRRHQQLLRPPRSIISKASPTAATRLLLLGNSHALLQPPLSFHQQLARHLYPLQLVCLWTRQYLTWTPVSSMAVFLIRPLCVHTLLRLMHRLLLRRAPSSPIIHIGTQLPVAKLIPISWLLKYSSRPPAKHPSI